jgi:hypothetical protein
MATRFITKDEKPEDYEDRYQAIITLPELTEEALEHLLNDFAFSVFMDEESKALIRKQFKEQMEEKNEDSEV